MREDWRVLRAELFVALFFPTDSSVSLTASGKTPQYTAMCISESVGGASGTSADVKTIQVLLNFARQPPRSVLVEDGLFGNNTRTAILEFQRDQQGVTAPDGQVDPGGATLEALRRLIPAGFAHGHLQMTAVHAKPAQVEKYCEPLEECMNRFEINTPMRRAHFLAQLCHESGHLRYSEEIASGEAYEGRADLGNNQPGDGVRFKGRGLIQLTGRSNYEAFGRAMGETFNTDATVGRIANEPLLAVGAAGWFWHTRELNARADADDIEAVTRRINGGTNGLADRRALYQRARCAFSIR